MYIHICEYECTFIDWRLTAVHFSFTQPLKALLFSLFPKHAFAQRKYTYIYLQIFIRTHTYVYAYLYVFVYMKI